MKILIVALFYSFNTFAIYGVDNRMDYYQIKEEKLKEVARAMAYQTYRDDSSGWDFSRFWKMKADTLEAKGVCAGEDFSSQPAFSRSTCTAILVSPNKLLTAGNCLTEHYCKNDLFYWVFNYHMDSADEFSLKRPRKDFYQCKKIIKKVYDPSTFISYTLLELKKEVKGITPVKFNLKNNLKLGDELIVMGHSYGMPLKIAFDTQVTQINNEHLLANSDIAGKNAGSALINPKTLELEGILIDGRKDYIQGPGGCKLSEKLGQKEGQELGIKTSSLKALLDL